MKKEFMEQEFVYGAYESPIVEIIEVEVEQGFAVSNEGWNQGGVH